MPKEPKDDDSFLGRWSRNKRAQPVVAEPAPQAEPDTDPAPEPEEESLSEEEIAALPALDDLTPQTDIRVFLQKGVPQALRNAALRRKWMLVPGIRDHKDPAVDYAWDWNTPGGVPGDGAAPSPERAAQMLRELFAPRRDAETAPDVDRVADQADDAADGATDVAAQQNIPAAAEPEVVAAARPEPDSTVTHDAPQPGRRRHGGAMPG